MLQELWEMEILPETGWVEFSEWLKKMAAAHSENELVLDAYGARPDTGGTSDFNKAWLVLEFESLIDRQQYYDRELHMTAETKKLTKEGQKFITGKLGHFYIHVFK